MLTSNAAYFAIFSSMFALATISLVLRLWVKRFMTARRFQLDDWIMIFAWAILLAIVILLCEIIKGGIINLEQASFEESVMNLRIFFALPLLHSSLLWTIKFAILVFYNRIFSQRRLKLWINITAIFLAITLLGCYFTQIFYCRPISVNFDPTIFASVCASASKTANIVYCVLSVVTDLMVMAIPLWTLRKLRISTSKKIALACLFALASFTIISSIIRCLRSIFSSTDLGIVLVWATVEEVVAMIVANGPILRPLFFRGKHFDGSGNSGNRLNEGTAAPDVYELATAKNDGLATNGMYPKKPFVKPVARSAAPSARDTMGVLRTIDSMLNSEGGEKRNRKVGEDDDVRRSSESSELWLP